jgi:hypothetical protein
LNPSIYQITSLLLSGQKSAFNVILHSYTKWCVKWVQHGYHFPIVITSSSFVSQAVFLPIPQNSRFVYFTAVETAHSSKGLYFSSNI